MVAASIRPKDKTIVTPERRLILEWDAFFERLENRIISIEDRLTAAEGLPSSGLILLTSGTVSNAATLDIPLTAYTAYRSIKFVLGSFIPATDDVELWMRFSTDGGTSYDATGYSYSGEALNDAGTGKSASSASANQILIAGASAGTDSVSNVASEGGADADISIFSQTSTSRWSRVLYSAAWHSAFGEGTARHGHGQREAAQDTDAVRFLFESGNITSGTYGVYGFK